MVVMVLLLLLMLRRWVRRLMLHLRSCLKLSTSLKLPDKASSSSRFLDQPAYLPPLTELAGITTPTVHSLARLLCARQTEPQNPHEPCSRLL